MGRAILLVVTTVEITAPTPFFGPHYERARVVVFDHRREIENAIAHLVHGRARRVNVAVRRMPNAGFVIQDVITQAAVCVRSPP